MFPSVDFLGVLVVSSCNALLWYAMARWVPIISVIPWKTMVHLLLLASLLRGLTLLGIFSFLLWLVIPLLPL
jgi:hypothetical protein